MIEYIAIILAILIGIAHFFSEKICKICSPYFKEIISLSAGISITYIFLDLFPQFSSQVIQLNEFLFLSLLIGFVVIHLIEKYVYQHIVKKQIKRKLGVINQIFSVIYHIILGTVIYNFSQQNIEKVLLLFVPIFIFTAVSTLPVSQHPSNRVNFLVSLSTLIGVLLAIFLFIRISPLVLTGLVGFVIGSLLFSVIRHSIPVGVEGKPLFFVLGVLIYTPIVILSWVI